MNTKEKLEAVRKACIKANPEIFIEGCESGITPCDCHWHKNYPPNGNKYRPIRLADVMLAMNGCTKALYYGIVPAAGCGYARFVYQDENAGSFMGDEPVWWLDQSLERQSEETISFLYELLK